VKAGEEGGGDSFHVMLLSLPRFFTFLPKSIAAKAPPTRNVQEYHHATWPDLFSPDRSRRDSGSDYRGATQAQTVTTIKI
jgi:hypothetical protein